MADEARARRWTAPRLLAAVVGAAGVALVAGAALQVEDWSRDLTTNHARTAPDARDERLRPLRSRRAAADLARLVEEVARELPGWSVAGREVAADHIALRLVRTTRVFRFDDDVTVRIVDAGDARVIDAESRSRVGAGDLGQNPRNLRELLGAVRERLAR